MPGKHIKRGLLLLALFYSVACRSQVDNPTPNNDQPTEVIQMEDNQVEDRPTGKIPGVTPNNESGTETNVQPDSAGLANRLVEIGYIGLFQGPDENNLDSIWNEPGASTALAELALDPEAPVEARFLAAEILFYKQEEYPPEEVKHDLAFVYATALGQNLTGPANTWGLPGQLDGLAGENFVKLGQAAIPALVSQLDNETGVFYEGSQEATLGRVYQFRVKDLATLYISNITGLNFDIDKDPLQRDIAIERIRNSIN